MEEAKLTIKNYRCFSVDHPLQFNLKDGFTAFVGPNNSGKSFILKFFYEFRDLWRHLRGFNELRNILRGSESGINYLGVLDPQEIFYRFNKQSLEIDVELSELRFCFSINRSSNSLSAKVFFKNLEIDRDKIDLTGDKRIRYSIGGTIRDYNAASLFSLLEILLSSIYIPSFRNAINVGASSPYFDIPVGTAFIDTWHNWKVGASNWQNQLIQDITNNIKELFGYQRLEINASPELKTLQLIINDKTYKLHEIGSGISQFILVFASAALKQPTKPSFILIDEPESNLHPTLQQKFLTSLASYAQNGVLFATHSIGLARAIAGRIYSVKKEREYSTIQPFEVTTNYAEFLGELSFSTFRELGFSKVLLVEGPHDVLTFQQFLRKIGKDHEFVVMPLGGDSMINGKRELELGELKRISNDIYCWIDSEKSSENGNLLKNREEFLLACKKHKIKASASQRRAIENYFTEIAVKKAIHPNCPVLSEYEKLDASKHWPKEKNWRIALEMNFEDIEKTDLGKFLTSI